MVQTATARREFHLLSTEPAGGGETGVLRVPDGISRVIAADVVTEPITRQREMLLLIASTNGNPVRVNGATVGRLAVVRETDVVQLGQGGRCFHVAVHVHSVIGRAPETLADETCVICHRRFGDAIVYLCSICGHAVHHDTGDGPNADDCMLSNNCPSCQSAVRTDGYAALPEDLS